VRELMKPPFELQITFTNTVSTNTLPTIGTDHGIQRRVQVVPWTTVIADEEQDLRLKDKLKEEASGILNRIVAGAVAYLATGCRRRRRSRPRPRISAGQRPARQVHPAGGRARPRRGRRRAAAAPGVRGVADLGGAAAASGKPWSEKHLNKQLRKKRFEVAKSSNMKWQDIALRFEANDFCEHSLEGAILRPVETDLPPPRRFAGEIGGDGKPIEDVAPAPPDPRTRSGGR
jgi:putative DNA primase/helicase